LDPWEVEALENPDRLPGVRGRGEGLEWRQVRRKMIESISFL